MKESYFDGGILDYIGYFILAALIYLPLVSQHLGRFS